MTKRNGWITVKSILIAVAIVVLTALIIWGLYVVRERGDEARRDEAIKTAQERLDEIAAEEIIKTNEEDAEKASPSTPSNETPAPSGTSEDELPQTGPGDTVLLLAVSLITLTATSYVQSRRRLRHASFERVKS